MVFGYFTLFVALMISAVAEFYSIVGLTAIFSAAFWPIVIMGACLGVGKVTAAVWLKLNWERASWTYKLYLVPAVAFLMLLTSMGIFGFLSKAHSDQSMVSGDSMAKVAIYDEKIKTAKDNIDANRKALKQMDEAVDQVMGRSSDEKGAEKAVGIRRSQQKERVRLQSEIAAEQKTIAALSEEAAPLRAEFRKVEAEVGPIKYIAALVYDDNPDANILEKAVRLVIILIVAVFDPLALVLILAAQQSLRWAREEKEFQTALDQKRDVAQALDIGGDLPAEHTTVVEVPQEPRLHHPDTHPYLKQGFQYPPGWMFSGPIVAKPDDDSAAMAIVPPREEDIRPFTEQEIEALEEAEEDPRVKAAKQLWKEQNPDDTLKHQRQLLSQGKIKQLPWMDLVADNELPESTNTGFGTAFPPAPNRGDSFVRVDSLPSVVYKYNGNDWIVVDKNNTDSYTYDEAYIDHLIDQISSGEYDADLLTDAEREQVAQRLQYTNTNNENK